MKGRNSTTISFRIGDDWYTLLKDRADKLGITPAECAKRMVFSVCRTANTTEVAPKTPKEEWIAKQKAVMELPAWYPCMPKGTRCRVLVGKYWREEVAPETDVTGEVIPE